MQNFIKPVPLPIALKPINSTNSPSHSGPVSSGNGTASAWIYSSETPIKILFYPLSLSNALILTFSKFIPFHYIPQSGYITL